LGEVELPNVALVQSPSRDGIDAAALVLANAVATMLVPFDDGLVGKPGLGHAKREAPGTSE
jgi:hypothetical protein